MYRPREISTQQFPLQNSTIGVLYETERDILRLDARIKYSPFASAIRKTLSRGDGLGVLNIKSRYPDIYTVMRIETASYLASTYQNETAIRSLLANESLPTLDDSFEAFHFTKTTDWLTDPKNNIEINTPEDMLDLYARCESSVHANDSHLAFRTRPYTPASNNPADFAYEPPSPEEIRPLLEDFIRFVNSNTLSPLAQAGIAQFQFEAIVPFSENLDRMERLIIDYIINRRKLVESIIFPLNFFAAHTKDQFFNLLRPYLKTPDVELSGTLPYVEKLILNATNISHDLLVFIVSLHKILSGLVEQWRARIGRVDKGSALELLMYELVGTPILTISQGRDLINKSFSTTSEAFERLESAGIVQAGKPIRRNKTFEATEAIFLHDSLHRKYLPDTSMLRDLVIPNMKRKK